VSQARRIRITAFSAAALVAAMIGLSFASAPLYEMFCRVTGYGGTPQRAARAPDAGSAAAGREITVRFNADVAQGMPWRFEAPAETLVKLGEPVTAHYRAHNPGPETIVGTATYNVTPDKAGRAVAKVECFCFAEQRLGPGESALLPVSFFIDPEQFKDGKLNDVAAVTLSYTFFVKRREAALAAIAPAPNPKTPESPRVSP
jgi:cytochrome c oxidase assembly protein subunit 11